MNKSITVSDSLIGSLCREIEYIRKRYINISISLKNSKINLLQIRLRKEMSELKSRRLEIKNISQDFKNIYSTSISNLFLFELCKRSL